MDGMSGSEGQGRSDERIPDEVLRAAMQALVATRGQAYAPEDLQNADAAYLIRQIWPAAYRAGREDAAHEALDHDAKLNGVRSRALVEYANQHHVVDERGWCSCDMYAPGDDDQCPERVRLFAASLALVKGKPIDLGRFTSGGQENTP